MSAPPLLPLPSVSAQAAAQQRPLEMQDLDELVRVEQLAHPHPWTRGHFADSLSVGHRAERRDSSRDGLVGYIVAMPVVDELHLLNITVTPACQRQGHGRALLDRVVRWAAEGGHTSVWLEVRAGNQAALGLYRACGFEPLAVRPRYYAAVGGREDAVVMRLNLPSAEATP
ncbi:MAG: ribosomal protein S18-alanine N-acetyltransferase [Aquabacterium sp.]